MFRLKHNLEGANGVPSVISIPTGELLAETIFKQGQAVYYSSGKLSACSGLVKAQWVIVNTKKVAATGGNVDAIRVTPSLVFEVECADYDSAKVVLGGHLGFSSDGTKLEDDTAYEVYGGDTYVKTGLFSAFGGKIIDTLGASADGDKMLVVLA